MSVNKGDATRSMNFCCLKPLFTFCKLHKGFIQHGSEVESESDSDYFQKGQESALAPFSNSSESFACEYH